MFLQHFHYHHLCFLDYYFRFELCYFHCYYFQNRPLQEIWHNDGDQILAFSRKDLIFVFNFSPNRSFTDYGLLVPEGSYSIVLNTDAERFGGNALVDESQTHFTQYDKLHARRKKGWLMLYLPARTALVLKKNKE